MPQEVGKQRIQQSGRRNPPCQRPQRSTLPIETQGTPTYPEPTGKHPREHGLSDNGSGSAERSDLHHQPDESKPQVPDGKRNAIEPTGYILNRQILKKVIANESLIRSL